MQVSAHKDAVSLFERYAKSGDDPKLKDWAGKTLPALQHHLQMAQDLKNESDKTPETDVLSLSLVKKVEDIEKLARQIRDRIRAS